MQTVPCVGIQVKSIELGKLYADIDHTLVNFIHTWVYETMQCPNGRTGRYRLSVLAYAAAREFSIDKLGEEAMMRIRCFTDAISIHQILDIAQQVWHILSTNSEYWLYLGSVIMAVSYFHQNLFMEDAFLKHFGPSPGTIHGFGRLLARVMARVYYRRLSLARGEQVEQVAIPICDCKRHSGKPRLIE